MHILFDHLGYEAGGPKRAFLQIAEPGSPELGPLEPGSALPEAGRGLRDDEALAFEIRAESGSRVFSSVAGPSMLVPGWKGRRFRVLDFDSLDIIGNYHLLVRLPGDRLLVGGPLRVVRDPLIERVIPDLLFHIKSMRSSGAHDRRDFALPVFGRDGCTVDAHGGWQDAAGDLSKYLSHLGYAAFFAPQQTPLVAWALMEASERLGAASPEAFGSTRKLFEDELFHGADFLLRMQDPEGWFYTTVFDQWSWDPDRRMLCAYRGQKGERLSTFRAAYRTGGGLAVAALARASALSRRGGHGDYASDDYLRAARLGFEVLERRSGEFLADEAAAEARHGASAAPHAGDAVESRAGAAAAGAAGATDAAGAAENIIDDYCALLAAAELFAADGLPEARSAALRRIAALGARIRSDGPLPGWWDANGKGRPFYHAVEAGLPIIALLRARRILGEAADEAGAAAAIRAALGFELMAAASNPFGLAMQYGAGLGEGPRLRFFMPHHNETGYWWQGENARLASLATAAFQAVSDLAGETALPWLAYGRAQLRWITGRNPFDVCMVQGLGWNTPPGEEGGHNAPGGVMNGITAGYHDESDIAFLPPDLANDPMHRWRWAEQWLPHAAWLLLAAASRPKPPGH